MFWITENHFLFVGVFVWGNAETQTFSVSWNRNGFVLAESRTRKSGTVTPLLLTLIQTRPLPQRLSPALDSVIMENQRS